MKLNNRFKEVLLKKNDVTFDPSDSVSTNAYQVGNGSCLPSSIRATPLGIANIAACSGCNTSFIR